MFAGSSPITFTSPCSKAPCKSGSFRPPALPSFNGLMTLFVDGALDFSEFHKTPRASNEIEVTATFKHTKRDLVHEGVRSGGDERPVYFNNS